MKNSEPIEGQHRVISEWRDHLAAVVFALQRYRAPRRVLWFFHQPGRWENVCPVTTDPLKGKRWSKHYDVDIQHL